MKASINVNKTELKNVSKEIGLIELAFSGIHQEKEFQIINTKALNDLIFTVKEQNKKIESLEKLKWTFNE